ncbi:MAG: hypothetical protein NTY09_10965 [bacterium]|nr:hypothetical protein [bacterium]
MHRNRILFILTAILFMVFVPVAANAQANTAMNEFNVLMDDLVDKIVNIETAYSPSLAGAIGRTRRLDVYSQLMPDIESVAQDAQGRTDLNSLTLQMLIDAADLMDPADEQFLPILEELWVRAIILRCTIRNIGPETVRDYIRRESSSFVADRGNFAHPDFDQTTLTPEDETIIYFTGFGLVILMNMDGGPDLALGIYEDAVDLKGYFSNQLVFRAVDLDVAGLPVLEKILTDSLEQPIIGEFLYGTIASKLLGQGGQFGNELNLSDEWKTTIADWTYNFMIIPERLEARLQLPFYGVDFDQVELFAEALLGLLGPPSKPKILSLLSSDDLMKNVVGLESLRWFDVDTYPDDAGEMYAVAEPLMGNRDFTLAVLAKEVLDIDAYYTGEPYDSARRERLAANIPWLCDLMQRAYENQGVEYLSSTAWLDIYREGTLVDLLADCMPMVAQVINSDWASRQENPDISLPEGEVDLITYFMKNGQPELFTSTESTILNFLVSELDGDDVNPFRVWTYVNYLDASVVAGNALSDDWTNALVRLKSWVDGGNALIRTEELKSKLNELLFP